MTGYFEKGLSSHKKQELLETISEASPPFRAGVLPCGSTACPGSMPVNITKFIYLYLCLSLS
ncbi:MAG: hypothetical protein JSV01_08245 [Desulfobacterales bacterium]|nr:MAG: hypothetical protein JSV01_08245 [Desulfobacterales bacterium]